MVIFGDFTGFARLARITEGCITEGHQIFVKAIKMNVVTAGKEIYRP
jgi:hypothetical protein